MCHSFQSSLNLDICIFIAVPISKRISLFHFAEWQEDIKLPAKVDVEMKPADNESWYTVQSLAQNPRVKTSLPLQKRLISLIKTLQQKWKSREAKMVSYRSAIAYVI